VGRRYIDRWPDVVMFLFMLMLVAAFLFLLWAIYLLARFGIAFHLAARQLRAKWQRDDLSAAVT
jgi:Tfp pilus assembly protein PilO